MSDLIKDLSVEEKRRLLVKALEKKGGTTATAPVSLHQRRLWLIDQVEPGNVIYNLVNAVRISGRLNMPMVRQAIDEIVRRHESLRTTFSNHEGEPLQVILPFMKIPVRVEDLRKSGDDAADEEVQRIVKEEARTPFALATGPLLRITMLRIKDNEYIALIVMHHIITDGWSLGVFLRDLGTLYYAFSHGIPSPLPDLPMQFRDYVRRQRDRLQENVVEQLSSYWRGQLAGTPLGINLMADRPRTPRVSNEGARYTLILPRKLFDNLEGLSAQHGVTLFVTLISAFYALLYRRTGEDDLVIGSAIADREHAETHDMIGFLVNSLILRTNMSGEPTVRELLQRVRDVMVGAYAHQDLPFDMLVHALQPKERRGFDPLTQVLFILRNMPLPAMEYPGLKLSLLDIDTGISPLDLSAEVFERPDGFGLTLVYKTDLFEKATIERLARQYRLVLQSFVADADQHLSELQVMTESERRQLLVDWNNTSIHFPSEECAHHMVERQVEETPDAIAVVMGNSRMTYRQLNEKANSLALALQALGVAPEARVAVFLERSTDVVVAFLGILKAGGVYVPLDPDCPHERLTFMMKDVSPGVLFTRRSLVKEVEDYGIRTLCVEDLSDDSARNPVAKIGPRQLAYIIYTSGSTGFPKGILIEHRGLRNIAELQRRTFGLGPHDTVVQVFSFNFDASIWVMLMALTSGAALCIASEKSRHGAELLRLLKDHSVSIATLPPSVLSILPPGELPSLRIIVSTGESCSETLLRRWAPGRRFFNGYGPTETTIGATLGELTVETGVSIGRPFMNTQAYILDSHAQPVPVAVPGEIYIAGIGVARGYLNNEALTAEKFVPDMFSLRSEDRMYKTGDLGRYRPDGTIEFLGRVDHQMKLHGYRIEPGDIENTLRQHQLIKDTVVILSGNQADDKRLVAYYIPEDPLRVVAGDLRKFLHTRLPAYMIPTHFIPLQVFPLTANGKVDRDALPLPNTQRPDLDEPFVPTRNDTEKVAAEIWCDVLKVNRVGIHDNFFALGGHSLLAVKVVYRVNEQCGTAVPVKALFESPTVAQLAERIIEFKNGVPVGVNDSKHDIEQVVSMHNGGGAVSVYCVHHVGGQIHSYTALAQSLRDFQVYAIQSRAVADPLKEHQTLDSMVDDYVNVLLRHQATGPYYLLGYSSGGILAMAIANALEERGHPVGLVALLDAYAGHGEERAQLQNESLQAILVSLRDMFESDMDGIPIDMQSLFQTAMQMNDPLTPRSAEEWIEQVCRQLKTFNLPSEGLKELLDKRLVLSRHHHHLLKSYTPASVQGPMYLCWSTQLLPGMQQMERFAWERYGEGSVQIDTFDADHFSLMRPPTVDVLAGKLMAYLENLQTQNARCITDYAEQQTSKKN